MDLRGQDGRRDRARAQRRRRGAALPRDAARASSATDAAAARALVRRRARARSARRDARAGRPRPRALFDGADLVVVSPGVPSFAALEAFEARGRRGHRRARARVAVRRRRPSSLIGGTNGKSTTTALVGAMLERAGKKTFVGGNFGDAARRGRRASRSTCSSLEISSFQAERVPTLHARAHALLNITDDHLDRYPSFDAYARREGQPVRRA